MISKVLARRAVAIAMLGSLLPLGGCGLYDKWFGDEKEKLPGTRVAVFSERDPLKIDVPGERKVVLPAPQTTADWPQPGGQPAHDGEHPAAAAVMGRAWETKIGSGGGYRSRITAQPVIADGRVFAMDSDANVAAVDAASGRILWTRDTSAEDNRSTNIGGGLSVAKDANGVDTVFVVTGRADLLALEPATGVVRWRKKLPDAARSAPTIADGRIYIATIDSQLIGLSSLDGSKLWSYQSFSNDTAMLGLPAPTFADGIVIGGFGAGDLVALRASSGSLVWLDNLGVSQGKTSISDLASIMGMPVVRGGRVLAVGLGRQLVALDLRSGRRLWERGVASSQTPWVAGDWAFVLTVKNIVAAVTRDDGLTAWTTQLPRFGNVEKQSDPITWTGPVLVGDRLVVAGSTGEALAISPYTGEILGKQALGGPVTVAPSVAGGTLYIVTDNANLIALR
jgi:outer membrane protein assembly factor BamB